MCSNVRNLMAGEEEQKWITEIKASDQIRSDQNRAEQSRAEQIRSDQSILGRFSEFSNETISRVALGASRSVS